MKVPFRVHRRPRTTQELRRNSDREEAKYSRGRRRKKRLPNAWDDLMNSRWKLRHPSWKLLRRKQYKAR